MNQNEEKSTIDTQALKNELAANAAAVTQPKSAFWAVVTTGEGGFAQTLTLGSNKRKDLAKQLAELGPHQLHGIFRGKKLEVATKTSYQIG